MSRDPLKEVLQMSKGYGKNYSIPLKHSDFFKDSKYDLEYFKLSFIQRTTCFFIFMIIGLMSFFYSLFNIPVMFFFPSKFVTPYAFSNLMFFLMIGFMVGFKTYFRSLFSPKRRSITSLFILSTFFTLYSAFKIKYRIVNYLGMVTQIASFLVFLLSFVPGGSDSINGIFKMMFR